MTGALASRTDTFYDLSFVIAGLDPAIHDDAQRAQRRGSSCQAAPRPAPRIALELSLENRKLPRAYPKAHPARLPTIVGHDVAGEAIRHSNPSSEIRNTLYVKFTDNGGPDFILLSFKEK